MLLYPKFIGKELKYCCVWYKAFFTLFYTILIRFYFFCKLVFPLTFVIYTNFLECPDCRCPPADGIGRDEKKCSCEGRSLTFFAVVKTLKCCIIKRQDPPANQEWPPQCRQDVSAAYHFLLPYKPSYANSCPPNAILRKFDNSASSKTCCDYQCWTKVDAP